ncbi:hypothetical protein SAMN02745724_04903 [Pseudoalteromonas denitrificans DSM 6059]|uniref:Uncharacterized protein n=1 Tax=Pseudoalteromonas denitrificans DSM 6059 TaxID=1123010 RepID=A0A1I1TSF4_9GAMM|nr:hypothetical protein SAMN02745724_04903 [Pseudoalteromonas denitrificans DSM 6059]
MCQGTEKALNYQHGFESNSTLVFKTHNLDQKIEILKGKGVEFIHTTPNENL